MGIDCGNFRLNEKSGQTIMQPTKLAPPHAVKRPRHSTWHGQALTDDYAWLRADNWQEVMRDPTVLPQDIRAYLEAENAYMAAEMNDTAPLQEALFAEMKARIKEDDSTVPQPDGPWAYFTSFVTGGDYPRICRCPRDGGTRDDPDRRRRGSRR